MNSNNTKILLQSICGNVHSYSSCYVSCKSIQGLIEHYCCAESSPLSPDLFFVTLENASHIHPILRYCICNYTLSCFHLDYLW